MPGIGTDDGEKSEGEDHLFVYIAERDIAVSGINIIIVNSNIRRDKRVLYAPPCRIFVFQDLVDQFTEANGISICTEEMPAFFVSCFFGFDI